jgi:hypothetical protein
MRGGRRKTSTYDMTTSVHVRHKSFSSTQLRSPNPLHDDEKKSLSQPAQFRNIFFVCYEKKRGGKFIFLNVNSEVNYGNDKKCWGEVLYEILKVF